MASQGEFEKKYLDITTLLPYLISKYYDASNKYDSICNEFPLILSDGMKEPLPRCNANNIAKPWLKSVHHILDIYPLDSEIYTYCKNFNTQVKFSEIKNRFKFWIYIIVKIQNLFFNKAKFFNEIIDDDSIIEFSKYTMYYPMQDLITDLGYNYTENLYGKEKEFYLYFVNSIIEKPIDWNLYNFNPEYFINYYFI